MKTNLKAARARVFDLKNARKVVLEQLDGISSEAGDKPLSADQQKVWDEAKAKKALHEKDLEAADERLKAAEELNEAERTTSAITVRPAVLDKPWISLGEQLQAVAAAQSPGGGVDPRLAAAASGAAVSGDTGVAFLVQHDFSTALLEAAMEEAVLAPLCRQLTCGENSDTIDLPYIKETSRADGSRFGGVQVFWRKEAGTVNPKLPELGLRELPLEELMGLFYATDRTLKDARMLESIATAAFAAEFAFKLDDAIYRGDGVGKPLGMINSTGPRVQQTKESGQANDTIVVENISKMWTRVLPRSKARGIWVGNGEIGPQLDGMYKVVGVSGVDPRVITYDAQGVLRIKGRPFVEIEQASAIGDEGDFAFVDPSEYLLILKGALEAAQSMHVRFIYGENTYRWIRRVNGVPARHSALTPYKGAATKSTFVTLEGR